MNKVALIIIYNHQYNKNIDILEQIYNDRFSNIYHLVPFYNGDKSNVIPVYDCSFYFQGYVAQGFKSFFKEEFEHYFFIADDLILNPIINEKNYTEHLKLNINSCFLPGFFNLHDIKDYWTHLIKAYYYNINVSGVEAENQIPEYNVALEIFKNFGLDIKPLKFEQIWDKPKKPSIKDYKLKTIRKYTRYLIRKLRNKNKHFNLSYPLVGSYADIFVISSDSIKQFCHYCGVFSSTRLWVEIGLPTSMVLSAKEIITEKDLKLQGEALWSEKQYKILDKYDNKLQNLLTDFPKDLLYLHPIKLSKWNTKL
jgi:hypothetical protein